MPPKKINGRPRGNKERVLYNCDLSPAEDKELRKMIAAHPTTARKLVTSLLRDWMKQQQIATL